MRRFDPELIERARGGDPGALDRLLEICQIDVRNYARIHCRAADVEDAAQETLLAVTKDLKKLKSVTAFSSWLFTILKRECQRALRFAYRFINTHDEENIDSLTHRSDSDLRIDVVSALESLPPHYLQLILLRDFEEKTIEEIALLLGESVATIKSRLHRGRKLFREYLNHT